MSILKTNSLDKVSRAIPALQQCLKKFLAQETGRLSC